jgi:tetratricopeptide (TPR) repeat protein
MQEQQNNDPFIGRKKEIELFEHWLAEDECTNARILYVHDEAEEQEKKGGIGKTRLLREFAARGRAARPDLAIVSIDFFNVADRDRIVIAERVVQGLQQAFPAWSPAAFSRALFEYRAGGYVSGLSPEKDVADIRIRDALSEALSTDLRALEAYLPAANRSLLLFFDTFEVIEDNPSIAVLGLARTFPDDYHFPHIGCVIAGRNRLNWSHINWAGRQQEVAAISLRAFARDEMLDYLAAGSLYDLPIQAQEVQTLYQLTAGRPILIGLVADVLNHRIMSLEQLLAVPHSQFEERLVSQVNNLQDPLNWVILFMAHVYHRFNMHILDWIVRHSQLREAENIDYPHLVRQLPELSFVRRSSSGDDFVLHDEMRRLVSRYCWEIQDSDRGIRQEISRSLIAYGNQQRAQQAGEQELQLFTMMELYHTLFLNLVEGLAYFQQRFRSAVQVWHSAFARSLLQEVRLFAGELSAEQHYRMIFAGAQLLRAEENPAMALREYERLEREASVAWRSEYGAEILIEKGRCSLQLSNLQEAADSFTQALTLKQVQEDTNRSAYLLGTLGFIHRRRGELGQAMQYYQRCIRLHEQSGNRVAYADTLNSMGNVYRLWGRIEEALRVCKIGLSLRRRLFQERKASERAVGLSLSTLGMIYLDSEKLVLADQVLCEAFEIYTRIDYKKGIASAYNRLGEIHMKKGELVRARELFEKGQAVSEGIDPEMLMNSLNKLGHLCLVQGQWQEAEAWFKRAKEEASRAHDFYQQVESMIGLATSLAYLGRDGESDPLWQQARALASTEHYVLLLARMEAAVGDVSSAAGDYPAAFEHYGRYCQHAAGYNTLEYHKALEKISDALLSLPLEVVPALLTSLLTFWTSLGFDQKHPELVDACEEIVQYRNVVTRIR